MTILRLLNAYTGISVSLGGAISSNNDLLDLKVCHYGNTQLNNSQRAAIEPLLDLFLSMLVPLPFSLLYLSTTIALLI